MNPALNASATYNPTFQVREEQVENNTATLVIEPLEQGYGHTLGNSLRRVMLSSLPGSAITVLRINGVDHQYTTLEGVTQDIMEFILNVKQIRLKALQAQAGTLRLDIKGPKTVTAADIQTDGGFEVVNPDQFIAEVGKGKTLVVEMKAEVGVGYVMANERRSNVVGEIPIDSLFSPVIKVSYQVEATRVGRKTDYDKLLLQVQTDGSIDSLTAVNQAAQILARQFTQVFNPTIQEDSSPAVTISPEEAEVLRLTVEELDLPTRIANALRKGGFKTVGDLMGAPRTTIAKVKNLGEKSVDIINEALMKKGVSLGE